MANEGRKEPSIDPVKAQGILCEVTRLSDYAAKNWQRRWGFYCKLPEIQEQEAKKIGMSSEEYHAALYALSSHHPPREYPGIVVDPTPTPLPPTSSGMIGRRICCPLERFGRLVRTARDFPRHPRPPPASVYDPYKQTLFFLGSVEGDPISYKLPPALRDVTDEMWARPQKLSVSPFSKFFEDYNQDKEEERTSTCKQRNQKRNGKDKQRN